MAQRSVPIPLQTLHQLQVPDLYTPHVPNVHIHYVTSGRHGTHGQYGGHGQHGHWGQDGENGENGFRADPITATLTIQGDSIIFNCVSPGNDPHGIGYPLPLGDSRTSIFLAAQGGSGGHGGNGGHGGDGLPGRRGSNATETRAAGNGGPGQDGGHGGNGGKGGHSGHGANIDLSISPLDTDLLLLLKTAPDVLAGTPGNGGRGGMAGAGGPGGKGGSGYSWQERDGDYTRYRSRPGGYDGRPGQPGVPGSSGTVGNFAKDGVYRIHVEGEGTYPGRYDLIVLGDVVVSDMHSYGIIEPGTRCAIDFSVHNCGSMPTPTMQDVIMSIKPTRWLSPSLPDGDFEGSVTLPRMIQPHSNPVRLPKPIHFTVEDITSASIGPPLCLRTKVYHSAFLTRVNQTFPLIDDQATVLAIEYPLQMSQVMGHVCVVPGGEGIVAWEVKNVSDKDIGMEAAISRIASTKLGLRTQDQLLLQGVSGDSLMSAEMKMGFIPGSELTSAMFKIGAVTPEAVTYSQTSPDPDPIAINIIRAGEVLRFYRTILFDGENGGEGQSELWSSSREHSVACLTACLELGHPVMRHSAQPIQIRPFQVQMATPFEFLQNVTKVLLVTNNRTTSHEMEGWRELCSVLYDSNPQSVSAWNVSLYGGFSLKYRVSEDGTARRALSSLFGGEDMSIVFLNNSCTPQKVNTGIAEEPPLRNIFHDELLHACKDYKCRIYIAGSRSGLDHVEHILNTQVDDALKQIPMDNFKTAEEWAIPKLWPNNPLVGSVLKEKKMKTTPETKTAAAAALLKGRLYKEKMKKKGKVMRYFVLKEETFELLYYSNETSKMPKGRFKLKECSLLENRQGIRIQTPLRNLILHPVPNSGPSLQEWRDAIEKTIIASKSPTVVEDVEESEANFETSRPHGPQLYVSFPVVRRVGISEDTLKKTAEDFHNKLALKYPELPALVVYNSVPKERKQRTRGVGMLEKNIGEIYVFGGVAYETGNVILDLSEDGRNVEQSDAAVHKGISSQRNVYGFLKGLSFDKKVRLMKSCPQDGLLAPSLPESSPARFSLLMDAIISDVADELSLFSRGSMSAMEKMRQTGRTKSIEQQWSQRLRRMNKLAQKNCFRDLIAGSVKYEEAFRLLATLQRMAGAIGSKNSRISRAAKLLVKQMSEHVVEILGVGSIKNLKNKDELTLQKQEAAWKSKGLVHGRKTVKAEAMVQYFRRLYGLGEATASSKDGWHSRMVVSQQELQYIKGNMSRSGFPSIDERSGIMENDLQRRSAVMEFLSRYEPSPETVLPVNM